MNNWDYTFREFNQKIEEDRENQFRMSRDRQKRIDEWEASLGREHQEYLEMHRKYKESKNR